MRAMVFTRPGVVEMLDVPEPAPKHDEILVTVQAAGICGSELHGISTPGFRQPPLVMGHEFSGSTPDGLRVTVNPIGHCGHCDMCTRGRDNLCRQRAIVGIHRPGAFAERVAVPRHLVHELPTSLSWEAAAMVEPLANAVHAWNLAGSPIGDRLGIIGGGTIGLVCLQVALARGATEVTLADPAPDRQQLARELGATHASAALTGEFDITIDAVGLPATHLDAVERLRPGGTSIWLGLMGTDPGFDATALVRAEKTVRGSFAYTDTEFADAIRLAQGVPLTWASSYPLEAGAEIFTALMNGKSDTVKALLLPGSAR